jgi:hypothetical protein
MPTLNTVAFVSPLPVDAGGTGATDAATARTNIGAAADADVLKLISATAQTIASALVFSGTFTFTPSVNIPFVVNPRGDGAGNGQYWSIGIRNAANTDNIVLGQSSSNYATGGGITWVGSSTPFIYFNASQRMRIGAGTGSIPCIEIATSDISFWRQFEFRGLSSTATHRVQAAIRQSWALANDAARIGRLIITTGSFNGEHEGLRLQDDGDYCRVTISAPPTAIANGTLQNSQLSFHIDEGTDNLYIKVKYSNGTVKTSSPIALA